MTRAEQITRARDIRIAAEKRAQETHEEAQEFERKLIAALHTADGYLSLIGYRYRSALQDALGIEEGKKLADELIDASTECRNLVKQIER